MRQNSIDFRNLNRPLSSRFLKTSHTTKKGFSTEELEIPEAKKKKKRNSQVFRSISPIARTN